MQSIGSNDRAVKTKPKRRKKRRRECQEMTASSNRVSYVLSSLSLPCVRSTAQLLPRLSIELQISPIRRMWENDSPESAYDVDTIFAGTRRLEDPQAASLTDSMKVSEPIDFVEPVSIAD